MPGKIKVLLFDLGGVVIDISFDEAFKVWANYANVKTEALKQKWTQDEAYEQHERGEIKAEEYFASLRQSLSINLTDEQFREGWNAIFLGEVNETVSLLKDLKQHMPLYAFTNNNATHHEKAKALYYETLAIFNQIFCSFQMRKRKPEAEAYAFVAKEIGAEPKEIMFFDDSEINVKAAHQSGMQAVLVKTPQDVAEGVKSAI